MPAPESTGQGLLATWLFCLALCAAILVALVLVTWGERKLLARLQNRRGPTRTGPAGLLQSLADGLKHLAKEDIVPANADRWPFLLAPLIPFVTAFAALAVIPLGLAALALPGGAALNPFVADVNIGLLFILATSGLGVYGIVLGGYASGNRYALLGGLRAAAQVISYELILGLALVGPILLTGTLSPRAIAAWQQGHPWLVVVQFPSFILYLIATLAETNRAPFDLPEAESELAGGYLIEYSGIRFLFFYLAEYLNMVVVAAVAATVFLGGAAGPLLPGPLWLALKVAALLFLAVWIRATLPRFRYDQLMGLAWKLLLPLALLNIVVTAAARLLAGG